MKNKKELLQQIEKQIDAFSHKMWRKGYDGVFSCHLTLGEMPVHDFKGSLTDVLMSNLTYAILFNKIDLLFPLSIRTWWNNNNKGSIACDFKVELDSNKRLTTSIMSVRWTGSTGRIIEDKIIPLPSFQKMPDKATVISLVTAPKLVHKKNAKPKQ